MSLKTTLSKIRHNYIWNSKIISIGMFVNFILVIAYFIFILIITSGRLNDQVVTQYDIYYGPSYDSASRLFVFPEISLFVFLINSFLCYHYYKYSRALSYFLLFVSLFSVLIMIASYILIILFIEL